MNTLRVSICIASAAALLASVVGAGAAQPPASLPSDVSATTNVLNIASGDNRCPVETHPKAINPAVVECHAKFAPVPVIPPFLDQTTPEQRRAYGGWLISQLDQPAVCGEGAKVSQTEACAILIYVLDPRRRQIGAPRATNYDGPWTHVVRIYRITHPDDPRNAQIEVVTAKDTEDTFGYDKEEVWNLLAEQRAAERCLKVKSKSYLRDNGSGKKLPESCRRTDAADVRYYPALVLPRSQAEIVLSKDAVRWHFRAPLYYTN